MDQGRFGVRDAVWEKIAPLLPGKAPDSGYALTDGTIVTAHQKASGAKGGLKIRLSAARAVA